MLPLIALRFGRLTTIKSDGIAKVGSLLMYVRAARFPCNRDMGLQLFRKHLAAVPEVEGKTVKGLLTLIERER
jgi:hypothetical protein